jgi:hypothetical protein
LQARRDPLDIRCFEVSQPMRQPRLNHRADRDALAVQQLQRVLG